MSRNQRMLLVAAAVALAAVAFVALKPGGDEKQTAERPAAPASTKTTQETARPTEPQVQRLRVRGGKLVAGPKRIVVEKGERARIVVSSDAPDEIHVHGYDIRRKAAPGSPARFSFEAKLEGVFEIEGHEGGHPILANLVVRPS